MLNSRISFADNPLDGNEEHNKCNMNISNSSGGTHTR